MGATAITFDDIPNISPSEGAIPSVYDGLQWINGGYLNISGFSGAGYPNLVLSGSDVACFTGPLTIQTLTTNKTISFNSFYAIAGWSNYVTLTIAGYHNSSQLNTTSVRLTMSPRVFVNLNWINLTKVILTPSASSGYCDTGMENLCVTFEN